MQIDNTDAKVSKKHGIFQTRLSASRSSSVGPEGHFSFFHPKVKAQETIFLANFVFYPHPFGGGWFPV